MTSGRVAPSWTEEFDLADTAYLDAASTGPLPRRTRKTLAAFNEQRGHPWTLSGRDTLGILHAARAKCARLIGAGADEIALVPNTSTGLHVAALTLPLGKGKIILGHDGDFPANVYPWMARAARTGSRYEQVALESGLVDESALLSRLDRGDVGILTVSWVSFASGQRLDIARLGAACRARGIYFVVDAIQGVGTVPLDLGQSPVDVLACGAQKWLLSPWGSGFLYVRRHLMHELPPVTGGWLSMRDSETFAHLLDYDLAYYNDARKFEVATLAYQDVAGLDASMGLLLEVGATALAAHIHALAARLLAGLDAVPGLSRCTPREDGAFAGIVSCRGPDLPSLKRRLDAAGVAAAIRGGVLRFAPHGYNTVDDVDRALSILRSDEG